MSFNISNNSNINRPASIKISEGDAKAKETKDAQKEEASLNLQDAINKFADNDATLTDMLKVLEAFHATNITTNVENEKLTLSFKLNGKNYMIQSLSQEVK